MAYIPVIASYYGNSNASTNNAKVVHIGDASFYFSYETLVAVKFNNELVVSRNHWGATTGKHINRIDGGTKEMRDKRVDPSELNAFASKLEIIKPV